MGWNVLFQSPGYALVTNKILKLLDYDSIMVCREVSPIWKECIDMQRFWRVDHFLPLMDKYFKKMDDTPNEWKTIIPFIKTKMSVFDLDKLISGVQLYIDLGYDATGHWLCLKDTGHWKSDCEYECKRDQVREWCPLHWAVHCKNFEFVEIMIRTSFDFNTLRFTFEKNPKEKARPACDKCEETEGKAERHNRYCYCEYFDDCDSDYDFCYECVGGNNVLHKAARNGDMKMIKLIFKYAEDKKIDINAKNDCQQSAIVTAKDDPEVVKLLMKHCKYPKSDVGMLGMETLTSMAKSFVTEKHEPPKKKKKNCI